MKTLSSIRHLANSRPVRKYLSRYYNSFIFPFRYNFLPLCRDFSLNLKQPSPDRSLASSLAVELCTAAKTVICDFLDLDQTQATCTLRVLTQTAKSPIEAEIITWGTSMPFDGRHPHNSPTLAQLNTVYASLLGFDRLGTGFSDTISCFSANDLTKPAAYKNYSDSLANWAEYYKSLLAYRIGTFDEVTLQYTPFGFLVFDSPLKNAFEGVPDVFDYAGRLDDYDVALQKAPIFGLGDAMAEILSMSIGPLHRQLLQSEVKTPTSKKTDTISSGASETLESLMKNIQFHSCFLSHSHLDSEFCEYLSSRLEKYGVDNWYAPKDMKGGHKTHEQISDAIHKYDKLLLVLSENTMTSEWVATEIYHARQREKKEGRRVLFPIGLVEFDTIRTWKCFDADTGKDMAREIREYHIPDFTRWKSQGHFDKAFKKLLKDLSKKN